MDGDSNSVSGWITDLRDGKMQAASELWKRYSGRVVQFARREVSGLSSKGADEDDIALSVFESVFRGVVNGRYTFLKDRTQLWRLLVRITKSKSSGLRRYERCAKRGGGNRKFSVDDPNMGEILSAGALHSNSPTPYEAAELEEELCYLLGQLRDDDLRFVARLTLEGFSTSEIAQQLGVVDRTVRRKLAIIRTTWEHAAQRLEQQSP
jgi:RNA polymerase sigma factor (sigma-70 family)